MVLRIIAIGFIFGCAAIAWIILGQTLNIRTQQQDKELKNAVGQLWGTVQTQKAPEAYWTEQETVVEQSTGVIRKTRAKNHYIPMEDSRIEVDLELDHRRKGLLWYATYQVGFSGTYQVANNTEKPRDVFFDFVLPAPQAVYDNFKLAVGSEEIRNVRIDSGRLLQALHLLPGQSEKIRVTYASRGMDEWWYSFGENVSQVSGFTLAMHTDFDAIDFPQHSMSPTSKEKTRNSAGWELVWHYDSLLTGMDLGLVMPRKLNPGPWASQVSFAAPISLFLFFFLLFIFTTLKNIKLHPMNYFFIGAAFFSFHLLLAYLVDHISIHAAFLVCSAVSIFLVISYMRLVVGPRFALFEVGLSQFVYLVLFSYTFFFEGYTGLSITILCIVTLFAVMQFTGKVDWEAVFRQGADEASKNLNLLKGT